MRFHSFLLYLIAIGLSFNGYMVVYRWSSYFLCYNRWNLRPDHVRICFLLKRIKNQKFAWPLMKRFRKNLTSQKNLTTPADAIAAKAKQTGVKYAPQIYSVWLVHDRWQGHRTIPTAPAHPATSSWGAARPEVRGVTLRSAENALSRFGGKEELLINE